MKKSIIRNYTVTGILFLAFVVWTVIVIKVDVKPIGPENSVVGLAALNKYFLEAFGLNMVWYHITYGFGIIAIAAAGCFAVWGVVQFIKNKSIKKVDFRLLLLGAYYLAVAGFYILFEYAVVNYRPVILSEGLEASYPSSHSMIILCIMGTAMLLFHHFIKSKALLITAYSVSALIILLTVIGRTVSGVHWFSDIVGGVLLGSALIMLYYSVMKNIECKISMNQKSAD